MAKFDFIKFYLLVVLFLLPATLVKAQSDSIELITGLPKPPFIIGTEGKGMQLDIIRAAFAQSSVDVKFLHLPLARTIKGVKKWNAGGVITLPSNLHPEGLFISAPYIVYQNVAVSLEEKDLVIENITDLANKHVAAFQKAKKFLGPLFSQAVTGSGSSYAEFADQSKQITSLFTRQSDVIVLDESIFKYFIHENRHKKMYQKPFKIHYIFNQRNYSAGFDSIEHRIMFDKGISIIKESGEYQYILDRYLQ